MLPAVKSFLSCRECNPLHSRPGLTKWDDFREERIDSFRRFLIRILLTVWRENWSLNKILDVRKQSALDFYVIPDYNRLALSLFFFLPDREVPLFFRISADLCTGGLLVSHPSERGSYYFFFLSFFLCKLFSYGEDTRRSTSGADKLVVSYSFIFCPSLFLWKNFNPWTHHITCINVHFVVLK